MHLPPPSPKPSDVSAESSTEEDLLVAEELERQIQTAHAEGILGIWGVWETARGFSPKELVILGGQHAIRNRRSAYR